MLFVELGYAEVMCPCLLHPIQETSRTLEAKVKHSDGKAFMFVVLACH